MANCPREQIYRRPEIPLTEQGQILYRAALLTGFGLRVGTRSKAYFVEGQVNRRTVRTTIGRADLFSPEVARRKALSILGGNNPNAAKQQLAAGGITLADAFTTFFEAAYGGGLWPNAAAKRTGNGLRNFRKRH